MPMPMWGYSASYGWMGFFWMALSTVFWLALLGLLVWALVRWLDRGPVRNAPPPVSPPPPPPPASALDMLAQRYARGELDEPTYLRMRAQLEGPPPHESVVGSVQ